MLVSPATPPTPPASRPRRALALLVGASIVGAVLTGCSAVSDTVIGQAGQSACAIGSQAADQVTPDVTKAIGNIAIDPVAALAALKAADAALGVALVGITGEPAATAAESAKATLAELISLAQDAVDGGQVDEAALASLQEQFIADLKDLAGAC